MAWQPRNNSDVDRQFFMNMNKSGNTWESILLYLMKNKRHLFKKEMYLKHYTQQDQLDDNDSNNQDNNNSKERDENDKIENTKNDENEHTVIHEKRK
jgi:hypothetical protein